ncbi:MAG TPA: rhodanese-like domain-containing protein [Thermoplasmataceae archaeon]|nr:rhodanese-like domain-containing protein [Thermoplasmatales archaeon AK]HLH86086.1 rhodanese-like domain-containing protein [Thermoplasmataceae archaeon]
MKAISEIKPYDLMDMIESGGDDVVIIDVREPLEYYGDLGHIPGSKLIPLSELQNRLKDLESYRDHSVVFVCNSGERSRSVCLALRELGFTTVYNLYGGMIQWHLSGLEVEYDQ